MSSVAGLLLAFAATASLAANAPGGAPARPEVLFVPERESETIRPPLLPPVHGIDVPNRVTFPQVRYRHGDPHAGDALTYDLPKSKSRSAPGRRGRAFPVATAAKFEDVAPPWSAKLFGTVGPAYDAIDYDTNVTITGGAFIPPDPSAAVGRNHLVTVTNVALQVRNKSGTQLGATRALRDFFGSFAPQGFTFDPKVAWDEHEQRFLLVVLEQTDASETPAAGDASYIYLAVSAGADPTGIWYRTRIDAKRTIGPRSCWGDYPGFGFDEQAVYVALNMFAFGDNAPCNKSLLWIVAKAGVSGGFYAGATADVRQIDPYNVFGAQPLTTQVARIRGAPPSGAAGTWLVGFDGLSNSTGQDFLQVARLDNPLTSTPDVFVDDVPLGNVANGPVPPATQPGGFLALDAGDRRALDAAWRANHLWVTFTTKPPAGANQTQATAHWVDVNTSGSSSQWFVQDQGDIGGEQLGSGTHTFYPSVALNDRGDVVVGFSASGSALDAGAYAVSRRANDPTGTMSAPVTVKAGVDPYLRTFGADNPNRWGDYSSVSHDPVDQCFWVYNEWAAARGSPTGNEDGRWGTTIGRVCVCSGSEATGDTDLDGLCNDVDACPSDPRNTCPDLVVSKTDGRTSVNAGSAVTYTIVASNRGGAAATGATVTDNFAAPLGSCAWTCAATGGSTCPGSGSGNIAASVGLAANGSATFTATCTVSPTASGTLSNTATVALANEANTGNNSATDSNTSIVPRADLRVANSDGVTVVNAGAQLQYTIVASNLSAAASTGVVADGFAAPLVGCSWTCSPGPGSSCPASGTGAIAAAVSLAANGVATFTARCMVDANASGTVSNTATIAGANDPQGANNAATDADTVIRPVADLSISNSDGVAVVDAGASLAYLIAVRNPAIAAAAGIVVSDDFPSPLTGCSWACTASSGSACGSASGSGALNDAPTLAGGGAATYTATCGVPPGAPAAVLANTARVAYANDPNAANNAAIDADTVIRPRVDLSITKSDGVSSVDAGRLVTYTIVATNPAAGPVAGATVADTFAAPLASCAWTCSASAGGTCTATGSGNISDAVTFGASGSLTYVARCRVPASAAGTLANTATIAYPNDPAPGNDSASDTDTVIVPPIFIDGYE